MKTLVVEDDPVTRHLVNQILTGRGHAVTAAASAEEAMELFRGQTFDLVVLDVVLPGMDGIEFCRWVRTQARGKHTFVLVATMRVQSGDLQAVLAAGADDYLTKPYQVDSLQVRLGVAEQRIKHRGEWRRTEELYQTVLGSALDGFWIVNAAGQILEVNAAYCQLTGFAREELLRMNVRDLEVRPALPAAGVSAVERAGRYETRHRCRDGRLIDLDVSVHLQNWEEDCWCAFFRDITARKQGEAALRQSETQFRAVAESLGEGLLLTDLKDVVLYANPRMAELTGYTSAELLDRPAYELLLTPDQWPHALERDQERYRGQRETYEVELLRKDRSRFLAEVSAAPLRDSRGEIIGTIGAITDVTERRGTQRQLHQRVQFESILAGISSHFINLATEEIDTGIQEALQRVGEFSGADRGYVFLFLEDEDRLDNAYSWSAAGMPPQVARLKGPPGVAWSWLREQFARLEPVQIPRVASLPVRACAASAGPAVQSLILIPMASGKTLRGFLGFDFLQTSKTWTEDEVGLLKFVAEILGNALERKSAAAEIEKLAAFPRFNPNMVLEFSPDGKLAYFNSAARAMVQSLGKGNMRDILPADTVAIVKQCLAAGQSRLRLETSVGERTLSWSFFPIAAIPAVHCYAVEITERLSMESQLRRAQKMESIGQLAAGVAHDFNNLLTVIEGHSEILLSAPGLASELGESVQQIGIAAERAANLTRQLLTFSRRQVTQPLPLDLNDVIANVTKMLVRLLGEHIGLEMECAANLPTVYADLGMMEQILVNLAVNARDAMPHGGQLLIRTESIRLDAAMTQHNPEARPGAFACLSLTDTGSGMDAQTLGRIFEPFFTTKEVGKGTGLGLATVYGIVKQHQGWVEVASQVGRGSTFKVFLPVNEKAARAPVAEPAERNGMRGGHETILVVEDEPALCQLTRRILAGLGYEVLDAASGAAALKVWAVHRDRIDLLLTDMVMPEGVSGNDLAQHCQSERPKLKVIFTSGYSPEMVARDAALQDGSNFLQKPYRPQKLAQVVRDCLDRPG